MWFFSGRFDPAPPIGGTIAGSPDPLVQVAPAATPIPVVMPISIRKGEA